MANNKKNSTYTPNGGGNGRGVSKTTSPEEQNALRRATKDKQKPGSKDGGQKPQTTPTLLKPFVLETFEVRTCAAALLTTSHKEKVVEAFGKFFTKNSDDAFALIWALTFQHEKKKPLLLKVLDLSPEMVPDLPMLLKELAAQYRAYVDPSFMLAPDMSDEVKPAFNALYTESHAAALFVYEMCSNYLSYNSAEHVTHNLDRLGSDAENRIHGGILDLIKAVHMPDKNDRYALSAYLKPLAKKIHDFLKAMADVKAAEEKTAKKNASDTAFDSPLANLGKMLTAAGRTVPEAPVVPATKQTPKNANVKEYPQNAVDNSPKYFTYDTVASHYELFSSMALETAQLKELGIDPALILKNLDQVREFLQLATQLEDAGFSPCQYPGKETAIIKVLNAEEACKEAEAQLNT